MQAIGYIKSPYSSAEGMPIQPGGASETTAIITLDEQLQAGLTDLDGFSHIYLIYEFHQSNGYSLMVTPFLDNNAHGVFATRTPRRPNPIGLSIVRLLDINANQLTVQGADLLDGTPILDIKPYIEAFDKVENPLNGWMQVSTEEIRKKRSDQRFT